MSIRATTSKSADVLAASQQLLEESARQLDETAHLLRLSKERLNASYALLSKTRDLPDQEIVSPSSAGAARD